MKVDKEVNKVLYRFKDSSHDISQAKAYYQFGVEIVSNRLGEKLSAAASQYSFYNLITFGELLEVLGVYWVQNTSSTYYLSGKIHVGESENHEANCIHVYRAIVKSLTFEWDYVAGIDYNVVEVKYIESDGIDVYNEKYVLVDCKKIDATFNTYLKNKELDDFVKKVEHLLE